jgi:tripartite-type tricarboxylate transporter receptor subunit TctC
MRGVLALLACLVAATGAAAEAWPARPVKIVVPYGPGSGPDLVARILGEHMRGPLGQPVIIDNKAGALGTIGATEVAKSAPDGYTILLTTNTTQAANVALFKHLAYDPLKDFAPIIRLITTNMILVVRDDFPARTLDEFLAYARERSGEITAAYATAGSQVSLATLESLGRFKSVPVPYKSIPPAVQDVLGGEVAFTFADFAIGLQQIRGGKMRGLGVTSTARTPLAPDIPALAETLPGFEVILWYGFVAPAGTPEEAVARLHDAAERALAAADTRERFATLGLDPAPMSPDAFAGYIKSEIAKWTAAAAAAGIEPQ